MFVILITVFFFETVMLWGVNKFFYSRVENALTTSINYSIDYFNRYYSSLKISDVIMEDIDVFWQNTNAEVQLFSVEGKLISDSIGVSDSVVLDSGELKTTLSGGKGVTIERPVYSDSQVMAVSKLISGADDKKAILRFVTSLKDVDDTIMRINTIIIFVGFFVITASGGLSFILSKSIVGPLEKVTDVASKMADGQLKIQCKIEKDDEIGKLSETLNYMAKELLKKEDIKNEFISSVSHELRTPLTSIKGWAVTLQDEVSPEKELLKEGLDIIENESDRLTDMVEELLDFSRFVSGRITLNKDYFNVKELLLRTVQELTPRAQKLGVRIFSDISDSVGVLPLDENRIKQVVINILDNAIKFSVDGGEVLLSADYVDGVLKLVISDNGVGISEEDLPRVKEKFFKGQNARSHSGIGLSICDEIIKLHSGSLEIFSEYGNGTEVVVRIPCEEGVYER